MGKKLKIIRVTTVPVSLKTLLKGQLKFINRFHDVVGISSQGQELFDVENDEGIKIIPLDMSRQISLVNDFVSLVKMISVLRKERPDIVHSHTPKAGIISMVAAIICRVPHRLHTVAGLPLMEASGIKRRVLLFVEWLTYKCATKVYPNSNGLKQFILDNIPIPKGKLFVIGFGSSNGVDTVYFDRTAEINRAVVSCRETLALNGVFSFIFIGRIVKDKGVEELLYAFERLNIVYENTRLLVVGWEESEFDPISSDAKEILALNKNVINLGFKNDVRPFLASSDCLILASYREGFPNVVLQAGSMQIPAIVSDINGCNEIIDNEVNGLLVAPKSIDCLYLAMERILLDKQLCKSLGKSARKKIVEKFSRDTFHGEILAQYSSLGSRLARENDRGNDL